jgi:enoyl-[acyl-carrier protein] reductase III
MEPAPGASVWGTSLQVLSPGEFASDDEVAAVAARHAQGWKSNPEDAASPIGWLCSDNGAWINGQVLVSDGGLGALGMPWPDEPA